MMTVDRETLYQEVWKTPGRMLAKKYGVSDVALAKACKRHHIPRPGVGHWAKLAHGINSPSVPLPAIDDEDLNTVHFSVELISLPQLGTVEVGVSGQDFEKAETIVVPEELRSPHPLVVATRKYYQEKSKKKSDDDRPKDVLSISVSTACIDRSLRIFDTLIKKWESIGHTVTVDGHRHDRTSNATYFASGSDKVSVFLEERRAQVPEAERRDRWNRREMRYTGQLILRIDRPWDCNVRCTWADGAKQRIENVLGAVIKALHIRIEFEKQSRLEGEIRSRQIQKATVRREAAKRRIEKETKRRDELNEAVDLWHRAEQIRRYLNRIEEGIGTGKINVTDKDVFDYWIEWAYWYADQVDPLAPHKPFRDEHEEPENTPLDQLEWTARTRTVLAGLKVQDTDTLYQLDSAAIHTAEGFDRRGAWDEVYRVLEGLGYDMRGRR